MKEIPQSSLATCSPPPVRTHQEDGHLGIRSQAVSRHWVHRLLDLGLPSFQNCEKLNVFCLSHPVYGVFVTGAQTKTFTLLSFYQAQCQDMLMWEVEHVPCLQGVWSRISLTNTVATSHMWLLSPWNVPVEICWKCKIHTRFERPHRGKKKKACERSH